MVSVESQPLFGRDDALAGATTPCRGVVAEGYTRLADYGDVQPCPTGEYAEALLRGRRAAG